MRKIAHIIDPRTPLDMLEQLFALRDEREEIFSLGPPPQLSLTAEAKGVEIHKLTNTAGRFPGSEKVSLPNSAILHIWGADTICSALRYKNSDSAPFVLSLGHLPHTSQQRDTLVDWIRSRAMVVTVPTQCSKDGLLCDVAVENKVAILPPAAKTIGNSTASTRQNIRRKVRESLGISDSDKLVVVPAEMQRQAGHKLASWAHAIVEQLVDDCKIVFPGGGGYERSVRFFSDTTGYPGDIFFTGDQFTIRDILAAADIAVFFYQRNCGITILTEAMLAGLTIIATTTSDIASVCRHEENALLVKPDDPREASASLLRVIDDSNLGKRLGQNAAKFAIANFDPTVIRERLDEIYTKICICENA